LISVFRDRNPCCAGGSPSYGRRGPSLRLTHQKSSDPRQQRPYQKSVPRWTKAWTGCWSWSNRDSISYAGDVWVKRCTSSWSFGDSGSSRKWSYISRRHAPTRSWSLRFRLGRCRSGC